MIENKEILVEEPHSVHPGFGMSGHKSGNLNDLFADTMPRLFRAAKSILRNHHDSEDALQDGLLSALRHLDEFRGDSEFSTWLYAIIRNAARFEMRKQRSRRTISMDDQDPAEGTESLKLELRIDSTSNPEREYAQVELSFLMAQTLQDLPASYQSIIRLCDFEGLSGKEAAERLGLSVSALKSQHHRARHAIRESMGPHFVRKTGTCLKD